MSVSQVCLATYHPKVRFESKNHENSPKNGAPNMSTSTNSSNIPTFDTYDLLSQGFDHENYIRSVGNPNLVSYDLESGEEVEVVFDETTNLLSSSTTGANTYMAPDVFKT
ncbi:hypothetical protein Tco_0778345 [Tanacetum coccineum]